MTGRREIPDWPTTTATTTATSSIIDSIHPRIRERDATAPSIPSLPEDQPATTEPISTCNHVRHYPLDLPSGLPFERYEHRRLSTRDILVNRIVTKLLFPPTTELAKAYDERRRNGPKSTPKPIYAYGTGRRNAANYRISSLSHHNFGPIKHRDPALARDVEVLRKTLVTCSDKEWTEEPFVKPVKPLRTFWPPVKPPRQVYMPARPKETSSLTVEEEVLDIIGRYYMETDDAATRLWLQSIQPAHRASYETVPKAPAKRNTHKELSQDRRSWDELNASEDYKTWYKEDQEHLKMLQEQGRTTLEYPRLYDGGAFIPQLRRPLLESKVSRMKFMAGSTEMKDSLFFTREHDGQQIQSGIFPWPEYNAPRRLLHVPSWKSWNQKQHWFRRKDMPPVDFASGRSGRGLDRDGAWSTGQWYGDEVERGRTTRRGRRRATSEPPPGLFSSARLPISFNSPRELLIFPSMRLATIERRVRRRSLSRTRIAEMFNWDAVLETPPEKPPTHPRFGRLLKGLIKGTPISVVDAREQDLSNRKLRELYHELMDKFSHSELSFEELRKAAWEGSPDWEGDRSRYPPWWWEMHEEARLFVARPRLLPPWRARYSQPLPQRTQPTVSFIPPKAKEMIEVPTPEPVKPPSPCANCTSVDHITSHCKLPCGHCGAANPLADYRHPHRSRFENGWQIAISDDGDGGKAGQHNNPHIAPQCPVAKQNRCKCMAFPQFHVSAKCPILCARDCGNRLPPGHFRHKNAMSCQLRCCMCGIKGHSGMKCKLRRCRCGGTHLGQDCRFHPECQIRGCDRFLCGIHCHSCGLDRGQLGDGLVLVGQRCPTCRGKEGFPLVLLSPRGSVQARTSSSGDDPDGETEDGGSQLQANHSSTQKRTSKRKNARKHRPVGPKPEKEELPWYAPLQPRNRPIVLSKSGKSAEKYHRNDKGMVSIGGCR